MPIKYVKEPPPGMPLATVAVPVEGPAGFWTRQVALLTRKRLTVNGQRVYHIPDVFWIRASHAGIDGEENPESIFAPRKTTPGTLLNLAMRWSDDGICLNIVAHVPDPAENTYRHRLGLPQSAFYPEKTAYGELEDVLTPIEIGVEQTQDAKGIIFSHAGARQFLGPDFAEIHNLHVSLGDRRPASDPMLAPGKKITVEGPEITWVFEIVKNNLLIQVAQKDRLLLLKWVGPKTGWTITATKPTE